MCVYVSMAVHKFAKSCCSRKLGKQATAFKPFACANIDGDAFPHVIVMLVGFLTNINCPYLPPSSFTVLAHTASLAESLFGGRVILPLSCCWNIGIDTAVCDILSGPARWK